MKTLHFSIVINAPRTHVWKTMFDDTTYREWTSEFQPGSHYVGNWEKGSKIQFIGPDENGKTGGMTSEVVENVPNTYISIKHLGIVVDGVEDFDSEEAKKWMGFENYIFKENRGQTELLVDLDMNEEGVEYMSAKWPKALKKLKEVCEHSD